MSESIAPHTDARIAYEVSDNGTGVYVRRELIELLGPARAILYQQIRWIIEGAQHLVSAKDRQETEDGTYARVPQELLAEWSGMSVRSVRRHLNVLIEEGHVLATQDLGGPFDRATWLCIDFANRTERPEPSAEMVATMRTECPDGAEVDASMRPEVAHVHATETAHVPLYETVKQPTDETGSVGDADASPDAALDGWRGILIDKHGTHLIEEAERLCDVMADKLDERGYTANIKPASKAWVTGMTRCITSPTRADGNAERVANAIEFLYDRAGVDHDGFWADQIRAPQKLYEKWDDLRAAAQQWRSRSKSASQRTHEATMARLSEMATQDAEQLDAWTAATKALEAAK